MYTITINTQKYIENKWTGDGIIESSNIARDRYTNGYCSGSFTSEFITALYKPFWARVSKVSKRRYIDNVITDKGTNVSELKASAVHSTLQFATTIAASCAMAIRRYRREITITKSPRYLPYFVGSRISCRFEHARCFTVAKMGEKHLVQKESRINYILINFYFTKSMKTISNVYFDNFVKRWFSI